MAHQVHCDGCGKIGLRGLRHIAPTDWFFLEAKDDEAPDPEASTIIVYACSRECKKRLWRKGPGLLQLEVDETPTLWDVLVKGD